MGRDIAQALRQQADRLTAGGLLLPGEHLLGVHAPIVHDGGDGHDALPAEHAVRRNERHAGDVRLHRADHEPQGASVLLGQLFHAVERADRDDVQARDIGKPLLQDLLNGAGAADAGDTGRQNDLFRRLLRVLFPQRGQIEAGGLEQMTHLPEIGLKDLIPQLVEVLLRRMQRQAARLKQQTLLQNGDDPARHARRLRQLRLQRGEHLHIREDQVARLAVECCDMVAQGLEQAAAPCGIHPVDVMCVIDGVEMARRRCRRPASARPAAFPAFCPPDAAGRQGSSSRLSRCAP